MKSTIAATHQFSRIPTAQIPRSSFDRSHGMKTTFDAGYLVPCFVDEALPGDTFNLSMQGFARMSTPIYPVMDNLVMETFFFAVPLRLVWDNFQKFMGEQRNPGDSIDYLVPTSTAPVGGYAIGSLQDYLGLPTGIAGYTHSALYTRCYNLIYNEWFRDQNLQNSVTVDVGDGPDTVTNYTLLRRGRRHDYFTSALPWPQKGNSVTLPLGTTAEVWGSSALPVQGSSTWNNAAPVVATKFTAATADQIWRGRLSTNQVAAGTATPVTINATIPQGANTNSGSGTTVGIQNPPYTFLNKAASQAFSASATAPFTADLTTATAATINQIRQAFQIQRMLERDARGGTRYTEVVRSHFGVISPDARLQRPEYLGGGRSYVNMHVVANTSDTATRKQGDLAAFATASVQGHGFTKSFTEHCIILGLVNVRADQTYQQGLNKMWSRSTRYDFYWPSLAHLGEQAVLNKEIYCQGNANDDLVFGYQERYAEYRYKPSYVTGKFRSSDPGSLDGWHLALDFGALPVLNASFIVDNPPMARVLAVSTEPHFIMDTFFNLKCARPMPMYGVPGLIDHF